MKKKKQIMTAALLSAFCMSVTGCSLYQGNKDRQPVNASQAETDTKDDIKQQPSMSGSNPLKVAALLREKQSLLYKVLWQRTTAPG